MLAKRAKVLEAIAQVAQELAALVSPWPLLKNGELLIPRLEARLGLPHSSVMTWIVSSSADLSM
jgi:hypothetical protein